MGDRQIAFWLCAGGATAYVLWSRSGRRATRPPSPLRIEEITEWGPRGSRGNLVAIQPHMEPVDYASAQHLHDKLGSYMQVAQEQGWLTERSIVVLPEYIGTWLVVSGEKERARLARTLRAAMAWCVLGDLPGSACWYLLARARDRLTYALFRRRAARMAREYQEVFSALAAGHQVTLVAGSIVLPEPQVMEGRLRPVGRALQNVAAVFRPDGSLEPKLARKVYLTASEKPFTASARLQELPTWDTAAGRLGVLICADAWFPEPYLVLKRKGVEIIAVPSYFQPDGAWSRLWQGYSGWPAPLDVCPEDVNRISAGQAWLRYALAGRMRSAGALYGLNVFLRGRLWDLGADGHTIAVRGDETLQAAHVEGAGLAALWL